MGVQQTIARNTMYNALGRGLEALVSIVLVPYIVWRIGITAWGLWALVSVFTGYVALLDTGIGSGFSKFIAEHHARGDSRRLSQVVTTGLSFYMLLGAAVLGAGWFLVPWCIEGALRLVTALSPQNAEAVGNSAMLADAEFLFRGALVLFVAGNCIAPFTAIQTGLQRMGVTNVLSAASAVIKLVATIALLEKGFGVRGLLYANAAVLAFFGAASIAAAFRLEPSLRIRPGAIDRGAFRSLFSFGWRAQVARLSNLVMFQTDVVIVGLLFAQLHLVGLYRVGEELAMKMRQVPALLVTALLPAASAMDAHDRRDQLQRLYIVSTKYMAVATLPLVAVTASSADMIMTAWMGPEYDTAAAVLRLLAVGYIANILPGAGVTVALGMGRADIQMYAGLIATIANIALTIAFVFTLGFMGIALATACSTFLSWAWFLGAMRRCVGVSATDLFHHALRWPAFAALPAVPICLLGEYAARAFDGRVENATIFVVCAALSFGTYAILLRKMPFFDAFDLRFLEDTLALRRLPGYGLWRAGVRRA